MDTLTTAANIIAYTVACAACLWLMRRNQICFVAFIPALISMFLRISSVAMIEFLAPVYSRQLDLVIPKGNFTILIVIYYALFFLPAIIVVSTMNKGKYARVDFNWIRRKSASKMVLLAYYVFLVGLFMEMASTGVIPLFERMERFVYTAQHGGVLHGAMLKYNAVISLILGAICVEEIVIRRQLKWKSFLPVFGLMTYMFLAGHRFAAFNKIAAFFAVPFAVLKSFEMSREMWGNFWRNYGGKILVVILIAVCIPIAAILNSYFNVRVNSGVGGFEGIRERLFVQQGEFWPVIVMNILEGRMDAGLETKLDFILNAPIIPDQNTSIQFLMYQVLGEDAIAILERGQQFAGGFPEISLVIFGPFGAFVFLIVAGVIYGYVVRLCLICVAKRRIVALVFGSFLYYSFMLLVYNGMLNQFTVTTYFIKVLCFIGVMFYAENTRTMRTS